MIKLVINDPFEYFRHGWDYGAGGRHLIASHEFLLALQDSINGERVNPSQLICGRFQFDQKFRFAFPEISSGEWNNSF